MKVLGIFANPRGSSALRLGQEDKTIRECIRRSRYRDKIELVVVHASTVDDLRRALLDDDYSLIHFSGHGTQAGLVFEDSDGALYVPPTDALASLLADYSPPLQCAVLNACYSVAQGSLTSLDLPFTIAMERPISDDAAILFAGAFYDSLGAGKDFEFSFRQGVHALRLAGRPDYQIPVLLRPGQTLRDYAVSAAPAVALEQSKPKLRSLVGIAIDVSGSMETSISNPAGQQHTRLEAFNRGLGTAATRVRTILETPGADDAGIDVFAYAFGLRTGGTADLFTLLRVAHSEVTPELVERLTHKHTESVKARYQANSSSGLESLARSYLGGGFVDSMKAQLQRAGEEEVRSRVFGELGEKLRMRSEQLGDTTLSLADLAALWKNSSSRTSDLKALLFGDTPMCAALSIVTERFAREASRGFIGEVARTLLIVTDGESTDGDPVSLAQRLRDSGVMVVSCYLAAGDVDAPKRLFAAPAPNWPKGAVTAFELSSTLQEDSPLTHYLVSSGWTVEQGARCFIQANHSDLLTEALEFALRAESTSASLPVGR